MRARNAVLILIDSLRADHVGAWGYFRDTTPNLDRLARSGAMFRDHRASAVAVGPGMTSLVTGLMPMRHGFYVTPMREGPFVALPDDVRTLPERLMEKGFVTAAVDSLIAFPYAMAHFARGFEHYYNVAHPGDLGPWAVPGERVQARALDFLRTRGADPFFLLVHYWDPHVPYAPPPAFQNRFKHRPGTHAGLPIRTAEAGYGYVPGWGPLEHLPQGESPEGYSIDRYDDCVAYADQLVGELAEAIERLGRREDTLFVVTSPCGAGLGGHGHWGNTGLYEQTARVPLVLTGPGIDPGTDLSGDSSHVDMMGTILEALGLPVPDGLDGSSLLPRLVGEAGASKLTFMESGRYRAVHASQWKLIQSIDTGAIEMFSLDQDPMELKNLADTFPEKREALLAILSEWVKQGLPKDGREDPILIWRDVWGEGVSDLRVPWRN